MFPVVRGAVWVMPDEVPARFPQDTGIGQEDPRWMTEGLLQSADRESRSHPVVIIAECLPCAGRSAAPYLPRARRKALNRE